MGDEEVVGEVQKQGQYDAIVAQRRGAGPSRRSHDLVKDDLKPPWEQLTANLSHGLWEFTRI